MQVRKKLTDCRTVQDIQDVIVPERPAVHCSMHRNCSDTNAVMPLTHRIGRLQNHPNSLPIANHVGSLMLLAGAPGSTTGSTTGVHR